MDARFWRIRGRDATDVDQSAAFWAREEVGIWYGAWSAADWHDATAQAAVSAQEYLTALPQQQALWPMPKTYVDTARRFDSISPTDWVVTFHDDSLHLGRLAGPLRSTAGHPLNCGPELFKFRVISETKRFALVGLPDPYRLIPPAGRGNVFELRGTNHDLLAVLARCESERAVAEAFRSMPIEEWLDRLSPGEWESLSLGYLIQEEAYLPTGLAIGRTLPTVDIVGVNARTGQKILAQCKNTHYPLAPEPEFLSSTQGLAGRGLIYFFAYGGAYDCPDWVRIISRDEVMTWLAGDAGLRYLQMWRSA